MKTYWTVEVFLTSAVVSSKLHAPPALSPEKESSWYSLDRNLDRTQSQSGYGGEGKKTFSAPLNHI